TRFDILQRTAPSNQFAIVTVWEDQKAYDAHLAAAHSKEFRDRIKPYLISAIDDRVHTGMEIAGTPAVKNGRGAIRRRRRTSVLRRSRPWWRTAARKRVPCASTCSSRAIGRTTSRWLKSGRTRARTTPTSRRRRPKNFATSSRP